MYETVKVIRLSDMDEESLLGMIGLGVKKNLQVCYGGKNENFENVVAKFAVA